MASVKGMEVQALWVVGWARNVEGEMEKENGEEEEKRGRRKHEGRYNCLTLKRTIISLLSQKGEKGS